ncbi:similar to ribosomal large subunit pseudouridine synthase D, Bacillus subtilis YhcT type [Paenibacillus sp. JCM 10914]|nr:similar to ribosomal large subunit pseudouridine synthase D, Bacillus subtilis YhcT type [Paenibacillus sp. JCM 10914]
MTYQGAWSKRGEWLELMPGKWLLNQPDRDEATASWLLETMGMPAKLYRKLRHEQGIQWRGDRLRLILFPLRDYGIEQGGRTCTCCTRMIFASLSKNLPVWPCILINNRRRPR